MDPLPELNPNVEWWTRERPFRHIVAQKVFGQETYNLLEQEFVTILNRSGQSAPAEPQLRKTQSAYDAHILPINQGIAAQFAPLFERRWIEMLATLVGLTAIPQIDGALHHIPAGSRSGWIHNDFCSGWFNDSHRGATVLPDRQNCEYFTGTAKSRQARPKEFVRAATMIFYLYNDGWRAGCGGETGLYSASRKTEENFRSVEPISNSLLLFDCSPHSYHSLIANPGCARNSIILWLHSTLENAEERWGRGFTRRKPK